MEAPRNEMDKLNVMFSNLFVKLLCICVTLLIAIMLTVPVALAEEVAEGEVLFDGDGIFEPGEDYDAELVRSTQNPVSMLISVPFQSNWNFNTGPRNKTQHILNIQPVYPISLNDDWNLIARTIFPILSQPSFAPGMDRENGLGDIQFSAFFAPTEPGKLIWGAGPALRFPTATDDVLGGEKWAAGPSAVAPGSPRSPPSASMRQ